MIALAEAPAHRPVRVRALSFPHLAAAIIGLAMIVWGCLRLHTPAPWFPLDDPYITLHGAQVLHWGRDPNFPATSPLAGATSVPFLSLVYLLLFVSPPAMALSAACWIGATMYVLGLLRLVLLLHLRGLGLAAVLCFGLLSSYTTFQLVNGLETSWVMAAVVWSLTLATERRLTAATLAAGIAGALRPEFVLYAALFALALGWQTRSPRRAAVLLLLALAPALPGALWSFHATGAFVPQTASAKRYFFAQEMLPWRTRLKIVGLNLVVWMLSCGTGLLACRRVRRSAVSIAIACFIALLVAVAAATLPGSLSWNSFRYMAPVTPMLAWLLAHFAHQQETRSSRKRQILLAIASAWCICFSVRSMYTYTERCQFARSELATLAIWGQTHLPADAVLLIHDAGYMAYATPFRLVDMVGLKTPQAIAINRRLERQNSTGGHAEAIAEIAAASHAGYMVLYQHWWDMDEVPENLRRKGWSVEPLREAGAYRVWRITPAAH